MSERKTKRPSLIMSSRTRRVFNMLVEKGEIYKYGKGLSIEIDSLLPQGIVKVMKGNEQINMIDLNDILFPNRGNVK